MAADLTCSRCKETKSVDRFSRDRNRKSGRFPWCKTCQVENNRAHRETKNRTSTGRFCPLCGVEIFGHANRRYCSVKCKERTKALRDRFGLTVTEYRELVDSTGGRCPICLQVPERWNVDHDHRTGKVTGVVCTSCNIGALSRTFHDPAFIRRLLSYVEDTPANQLGISAAASTERPSNLHTVWHQARMAQKIV